MTILSAYAPVREAGDGSKVAFDFDFRVQSSADLSVGKILNSTEVKTTLVLGVDYTVTINAVTDGGTVTYTVAPTLLQDSWIGRVMTLTQGNNIPTNGPFREVQMENGLDKAMMIAQEQNEAIGRCVKLPDISTGVVPVLPPPEDRRAVIWDGVAGAMVNSDNDPDEMVNDSEAARDAAVAAQGLAQTAQGLAEDAQDAAEVAQAAAELAAANFEFASQAEAEAGVNATKSMNPLRTAQAMAALAEGVVASDGTVNPTNLLANGDFEAWSAGASAAPDGWTLFGAGASVGVYGALKKIGTYSCAVSRGGSDCYVYQSIHIQKGIEYWKGRTVTFGCWVYATVANRVRISLLEGTTNIATYSSYHTGNSSWQFLTVTATINASSTAIGVCCAVDTGDTSAYFDGAICVEGSSAFAFSPKPAEFGEPVSLSKDTVYQAATDGIVMVNGRFDGASDTELRILDGVTPSPATDLFYIVIRGTDSPYLSATAAIKKGKYWKVTDSLTTRAIYFQPIGA